MRDFLDYFREPKEYTGLKKYYSTHKDLPWGGTSPITTK